MLYHYMLCVFQNYLWFNIGSVNSFEHNLEMAQLEMGLNSTQKIPVLFTRENDEWVTRTFILITCFIFSRAS